MKKLQRQAAVEARSLGDSGSGSGGAKLVSNPSQGSLYRTRSHSSMSRGQAVICFTPSGKSFPSTCACLSAAFPLYSTSTLACVSASHHRSAHDAYHPPWHRSEARGCRSALPHVKACAQQRLIFPGVMIS
jgi:hypothetical protein